MGSNILRTPTEADACDFLLTIVNHVAGYTGSKTSSEMFVGSFNILIHYEIGLVARNWKVRNICI